MKTIIYYFSATGNSLKVAKDLAEKLGDTTLVAIPKVMTSELDLHADNIGIVYTVYCWGIPPMVAKFLNKLRPEHAKYFFAIATYGGSSAGTLLQAKKRLKKHTIKLASGFVVQMPTNYIVWGEALSEEEQEKLFHSWNKRVDVIANIIKNQKEHDIEAGSFLSNLFLSKALYSISIPKFPKMDKSFWSNSELSISRVKNLAFLFGSSSLIATNDRWNSQWIKILAIPQLQLLQMLHRPWDTNRQDCAHVGEACCCIYVYFQLSNYHSPSIIHLYYLKV
jgi:flavodoxin